MTNAEHFHLKKILFFLSEQKIFNFSCHNAATINFDSRDAKKLQDMENIFIYIFKARLQLSFTHAFSTLQLHFLSACHDLVNQSM